MTCPTRCWFEATQSSRRLFQQINSSNGEPTEEGPLARIAKVSGGLAALDDVDSCGLLAASVFGVLADSAVASSVPRYPRP